MSATQLPKPGDRFRWRGSRYHNDIHTVVAVTERNVHYEGIGGRAYWPLDHPAWLVHAIPIPPKPHVEPVQWGWVQDAGDYFSAYHEADARTAAKQDIGRFVAKLDHGVLFVEQGGEFVRAFEDGAG